MRVGFFLIFLLFIGFYTFVLFLNLRNNEFLSFFFIFLIFLVQVQVQKMLRISLAKELQLFIWLSAKLREVTTCNFVADRRNFFCSFQNLMQSYVILVDLYLSFCRFVRIFLIFVGIKVQTFYLFYSEVLYFSKN